MRSSAGLLVFVALALGCSHGPTPPAPLDTRADSCTWCRMVVSDPKFAAQIVAPLEEPKFFDDIGCLRDWARGGGPFPAGAMAYVADHRTKAWVPAAQAVYSRVPGLDTPMASGLVAHADAASRDADADARGGVAVEASDVVPPGLAREGAP